MRKKDLTFLLASGFILVLVWITLSIYHESITSTIPQALSIHIAPISPTFDTNTIEQLKKRKTVLPTYELPFASPSPQLLPSPTATGATEAKPR